MLFTHPVPRYVVPLGETYSVGDDGIRSHTAWWAQPATQKSVSELASDRSLALLGEPGIGKSTTIEFLIRDEPNANLIRLDEVTDVVAFDRLLTPTVDTPAGGGRRTLVLDGVDECPLGSKPLGRHVARALSGRTDVRVLVGCRTADWSNALGDQLRESLGSFDVFELLPLSAEDIQALATSRGVDGAAFLAAVRAIGAGPLAAVPLTLDLLLDLFHEQGGLPVDPRDLYERGLLLLANDPDPDRGNASRPEGSDTERLAVAARVAAAVLLGGRTGVVRGRAGDTGIAIGDLVGSTEPVLAGDVEVTSELIEAALHTALFSSRGPFRFGVSHASFAAYLTARYLHLHRLPEHQLRALLTATSTLGRTSVPTRLREAVAWLVAFDPSLHRWLVEVDPETVAAHCELVGDPAVRTILVAHLLDHPDVLRLRRRSSLAHPGLAGQLRPALQAALTEDAGPHLGHPVSRRAYAAIQIARFSTARELVPDIADLVACTSLNAVVRTAAAHALADLDRDTAVTVLRAVLDEVADHPEHDPSDELRGKALEVCWPEALPISELLPMLVPPQDENLIGNYVMFLDRFVDGLSEDAVVDLVRAVSESRLPPPGKSQLNPVPAPDAGDDERSNAAVLLFATGRRDERIMSALLTRALRSARLDEMVEGVGWLIAQNVLHHLRLELPPRFAHDAASGDNAEETLRRSLILATLPHLAPGHAAQLAWCWPAPRSKDAEATTLSAAALVSGDDLAWLFTVAAGPYAEHVQALIRSVYDPTDEAQQEVAWSYRRHPAFASSIGQWFESVEIDGPVAARMRETYEWSQPAPVWEGAGAHEEGLAEAWQRCQDGDPFAFADLARHLRVDPTNGMVNWLDPDISVWPSLPLLHADVAELTGSARAFLLSAELPEGSWLTSVGSIAHTALDACAAFWLLAQQPDAPTWFDGLPVEVWARWAPAIVRCPSTHEEPRATLLTELAARVPDRFADAFLTWVEQMVPADWPIPSLDPLSGAYSPEVVGRLNTLLAALSDGLDAASSALEDPRDEQANDEAADRRRARERLERSRWNLDQVARYLTSRGDQHAVATLESILGTVQVSSTSSLPARCVAASALLSARATPWETVFSLMRTDDQIGRAVACDLARWPSAQSALAGPDDAELGALWSWVNGRWSSDTDTFPEGPVTDDYQVREWRNAILTELANRATPTALNQLAGLAVSHPGDARLRDTLREAEDRQRDESWQGPTVEELFALVGDPRRTVVHDEDDLYRVVLTAVDRFAAELQTTGFGLWDETRPAGGGERKVWRPKSEPHVSDLLKAHLERELGDRVVLNREVQLRLTSTTGAGLSVDILASGGVPVSAGVRLPRCPVEVKGSWNPGLLSDLESQLVDDYMKDAGATRGIYVCAWFPIDQWTDMDDRRRAAAARRDRHALAWELQETADRVSASHGIQVTAVVIEIPRPAPSARAAAGA